MLTRLKTVAQAQYEYAISWGGRRQRILLLSKRFEELSAARRKLFIQLENLDAQGKT